MNVCNKCGERKAAEMFTAAKRAPSGRAKTCKACHAAAMRLHYAKNPERVKAICRAAGARWRARDIERVRRVSRESAKRRYHADIASGRAKSRADTARWKLANPDKAREVDLRSRLKRADARRLTSRVFRQKNIDRVRLRNREYLARNAEANRQRARDWAAANPERARAHGAKRRAARVSAMPAWADEFAMLEVFDLARRRTALTGVPHDVDHIVPLQSRLVCGLHVEFNLRVIPSVLNSSKGNRWWPDMPGDEFARNVEAQVREKRGKRVEVT